jgi:dihydrofolate reductase
VGRARFGLTRSLTLAAYQRRKSVAATCCAADVLEQYQQAIEYEAAEVALDPRWAQGRTLTIERAVAADPELVWAFWTSPPSSPARSNAPVEPPSPRPIGQLETKERIVAERQAGTGDRVVVGNIALSLDGRVNGRGGDYDMGWIGPHAISDAVRAQLAAVYGSATTVLLGRKNFEGFRGFWPAVAADASADPRDREYAKWLNETEKIVFSSTLRDPEWENARIVSTDPADLVKDLRRQGGGDIVVQNSSSIIRSLLAADQVDRLSITLCPELVGGGARLFEDGLPPTSWRLSKSTASDTGALCLLYDRAR